MKHGESLALMVEATQRSLEERLGEALSPHRDPRRPRDSFSAIDTFMAATSRHLAAVEAVLLRQVHRTVPDGDALVHAYLYAARRLETSLAQLKARLYGEAHAVRVEWPDVWDRVQIRLAEHNRLEQAMVDALLRHGDTEKVEGLARELFDAERHAPTRPHPMLPHTGMLSPVARRVWAVADRFWDTAEGRVIPDPVRPPTHRHDSLLAQYLVADPSFDDHAKLIAHRHRSPSKPGRHRLS
jgi:hypothetical protein